MKFIEYLDNNHKWILVGVVLFFFIGALQLIHMFPIILLLIGIIAWLTNQNNEEKDPFKNQIDVPDFIFISKREKQSYMQSIEWKELKEYRLILADNKCEVCGSGEQLALHHLHYRTWREECYLMDVVILCGGPNGCHQNIHNKYGYDYNTEYPIN